MSQMELSRDYIQERAPYNVFNAKVSSKLDHSENDINTGDKGFAFDRSLDRSYQMYQRVSTTRN